MSPLIINLAPTGMIPMPNQTPHVPISPQDIANVSLNCASLGASMVHIHARAVDGTPSTSSRIFAEIISSIRSKNSDLIITATTSGRMVKDVEERAASLYLDGDLRPDMASLTLGSMNFAKEASVNSPATIMRLAEIMLERGIKPELEIFDLGMVNFAKILIEKGLLTAPYYFNILLGNPSTAQANMLHIGMIVNELPPNSIWSLAGIGRYQKIANALGVVIGDGVRVGVEDNIWLDDDRTILASNEMLVERLVAQSETLGRKIASPIEARRRLGIKER